MELKSRFSMQRNQSSKLPRTVLKEDENLLLDLVWGL